LSALIIGMGQVYNEEYRKGGVFWIIGMFLVLFASSSTHYLWISLIYVIVWIYSIHDAEETAKKTIKKQPNKYAVRFTVTIFVILVTISGMVGILSGWTATYTQETSQILDDYNKHISLIEEDSEKITESYNNWVYAYNDAIEDNRLTNQEVSEMGDSIDKYVFQYKLSKNHIQNFKKFFYQNEDRLKTHTTVDVFEVETWVTDYETNLDTYLEYMKDSTEDLRDLHQQYNEQLLQYLSILTIL